MLAPDTCSSHPFLPLAQLGHMPLSSTEMESNIENRGHGSLRPRVKEHRTRTHLSHGSSCMKPASAFPSPPSALVSRTQWLGPFLRALSTIKVANLLDPYQNIHFLGMQCDFPVVLLFLLELLLFFFVPWTVLCSFQVIQPTKKTIFFHKSCVFCVCNFIYLRIF